MNQHTEQNINEAVDWLQQTGGSIQDFAVEQVPLYCREVVQWELWSGAIFGGLGLLLLMICIVSAIFFARWMKEDDCDCNYRTLPSVVVAIACLIFGGPMVIENIPRAVKASVAPRLVIVEHLRNLK